jgi:tRNA 2-selenouridine synthase
LSTSALNIARFLELSRNTIVLDVRSPGEYNHAHIPGATSFPLFTDEERRVVGTAYKQQSREAAIRIGLDYFGPKMRGMVEKVESLLAAEPGNKHVLVHCWRGGMRSGAVAWLLGMYGFKVSTLAGGYKKFRNWVIETLSAPIQLNILGGYTGSGKTHVLDELQKAGLPVINLEKLASHKGSAFGNIGMPEQPQQEMFENMLALEIHQLQQNGLPVWIEDESQRIGHINIPHVFWANMRQSPVFFIDVPFEERLKHVIAEYGSLDKERMANAISRIQKRLGPLETKLSLQHLHEGNIEACFKILLTYYDKWYKRGLNNRDNLEGLLTTIACKSVNAAANAAKLLTQEKAA